MHSVVPGVVNAINEFSVSMLTVGNYHHTFHPRPIAEAEAIEVTQRDQISAAPEHAKTPSFCKDMTAE